MAKNLPSYLQKIDISFFKIFSLGLYISQYIYQSVIEMSKHVELFFLKDFAAKIYSHMSFK